MVRGRSLLVLVVLIALMTGGCQPVQPEAERAGAPVVNTVSPNDPVDVQIANAMSAAPPAISKDATILGFPVEEGGDMVLLRAGSNGWTCMTDMPPSPGNDPACYDARWMAWNDAWIAGTALEIDGPGIAYMLQGGSDPSNTDPFAMAPAAGEDWVTTPPHIMLLVPGGFDAADFATEPKADEPYIMWGGTPYEHLMVPVVPMSPAEMGDATAEAQAIMVAAPAGIIHKATILGNPAQPGGDMVTLQTGDSSWVCYADRLVSPGNDPACYDPVWEALFAVPEPSPVTRPGISYMLVGGSDESNTDPMATGPAPGEDWITTPPHLMLLAPDGFDATYFSTDPSSGFPYIMWDGTPYEHLMVPVPLGDHAATPVARSAQEIADQLMGIRESVVVDEVGPSKAADPVQAQAEDEFLAVAIAKEQALYAGDAERFMSYYADNAISVQPGMPEMDKAALAEAMVPYFTDNQIVGKLAIKRTWVNGDYATRQAEWEEVTEPKGGGPAEHHIGRCTLNWEKIDGEWKVVSEFVNYLEPPTPVQ